MAEEDTKKVEVVETPVAEETPALAVETSEPAEELVATTSIETALDLVESKAHKKIAVIEEWESSKKAAVEAELKKIEEELEKKKAKLAEITKSKLALIQKEAEEKKALVETKRGEELVKLEEIAAKCRTTGKPPKKLLGLF
ncbi:hypothetical protein KSS87_009998 [Heliosperma pusillum]|nr:hypothetical protein KSS87_009998 [Heliosperma pusillum]